MSEADRCGDQSGRAVFRFSHFKNRRLTAETKKTKPNYNLQGQTILVISSKLKIVCHHLINFHHHAYPIFLNILNYLSIYPSIHPTMNQSSSIFICQSIHWPLPFPKYNHCRPGSQYRSCCCCSCCWIFCLIYAFSTSTTVLPPIF